jgi:hypothetical protein
MRGGDVFEVWASSKSTRPYHNVQPFGRGRHGQPINIRWHSTGFVKMSEAYVSVKEAAHVRRGAVLLQFIGRRPASSAQRPGPRSRGQAQGGAARSSELRSAVGWVTAGCAPGSGGPTWNLAPGKAPPEPRGQGRLAPHLPLLTAVAAATEGRGRGRTACQQEHGHRFERARLRLRSNCWCCCCRCPFRWLAGCPVRSAGEQPGWLDDWLPGKYPLAIGLSLPRTF